MATARRVAIMFDPDQLDLRQRDIVRGVARFAEAAGHWSWVLDPFALRQPPDAFDGLLVPAGQRLSRYLARAQAPVVCVTWGACDARPPRVMEGCAAAGRLAARHLLERGYRTFAYAGFAREYRSYTERTAFRGLLRRLGHEPAVARLFVLYGQSVTRWRQLMAQLDEWLDGLTRPVGIFVARPGLARTLADLVVRKGLRLPSDVGLIAADDDPVLCEPAPALTSIHFDYAEVGRRAAELLDRLMDREPPPKQAVLIPPTLVPRRSTDRAAMGDPLVAKALYWIDDRRTEPIRPAHVAAAMRVTQRTLEERFRRVGRGTVVQEIVRARVEHAKILLTDATWPLAAAAHASGFGSRRAFRRAFRQYAGMPPSAWRRQAILRRQGAPDAEHPPSQKGPRGTRRKHDSWVRDP